MNASPFLLLLLLLLFSTCHGEQQNDFPASDILATTKRQEKAETSLEVSCPEPTDIEPCECIIDSYGHLSMVCSMVQDEEQLRKVFSAFFPSTDFKQFQMYGNNGVKVLEDDVFGNVSFQILGIQSCALETVRSDALKFSLKTLRRIHIDYCQLTTFPFERLAEFILLEEIYLFSNKIHSLPPLSSSSLETLSLGINSISHLSPDVFTLLPAIVKINLQGNNLTEVMSGTFTGLPKLSYLSLALNKITYLQNFTFDIASSLGSKGSLNLVENNISFVEVDTFKGVQEYSTIAMRDNSITTLNERVWRTVLERNVIVHIIENPLSCGCDVAWLVRDPELDVIGRCVDGTYVTDLDPADFDHCD